MQRRWKMDCGKVSYVLHLIGLLGTSDMNSYRFLGMEHPRHRICKLTSYADPRFRILVLLRTPPVSEKSFQLRAAGGGLQCLIIWSPAPTIWRLCPRLTLPFDHHLTNIPQPRHGVPNRRSTVLCTRRTRAPSNKSTNTHPKTSEGAPCRRYYPPCAHPRLMARSHYRP